MLLRMSRPSMRTTEAISFSPFIWMRMRIDSSALNRKCGLIWLAIILSLMSRCRSSMSTRCRCDSSTSAISSRMLATIRLNWRDSRPISSVPWMSEYTLKSPLLMRDMLR